MYIFLTQHVLSHNHKRKLAISPFTKHIHELTLKFKIPNNKPNIKIAPV